MLNIITKIIRRFFVGKEQKFIFNETNLKIFELPKVKKTNLYIHIPFCKSMCPYCPYNRVQYKKEMITPYINALLKEVDIYSQKLGRIDISSVYIGGGTPTNVIDELGVVIDRIKETFNILGDIAIETTVADINDYNIRKLKLYGVSMVSVGVQSFNDKNLKLLGRNYSSSEISSVINLLKTAKFKMINIDLIFAFPEQKKEDLLNDMQKAKQLDVEQITMYPLFTFPYSTIGEYLNMQKIKMPNFFIRRKFYKLICSFFVKNSYEMNSVWSFIKKDSQKQKYSSVTREQYIGLGAGAGSRFENKFYFNTFSIAEYEKRLSTNFLPIALDMFITKNLSRYYWFYWRLYDGTFSMKDIKKCKDWKIKFLVKTFLFLGFCINDDSLVRLTNRGSFWIHLAQNYFVLNYINKVWSVMKMEGFPKKIDI